MEGGKTQELNVLHFFASLKFKEKTDTVVVPTHSHSTEQLFVPYFITESARETVCVCQFPVPMQ